MKQVLILSQATLLSRLFKTSKHNLGYAYAFSLASCPGQSPLTHLDLLILPTRGISFEGSTAARATLSLLQESFSPQAVSGLHGLEPLMQAPFSLSESHSTAQGHSAGWFCSKDSAQRHSAIILSLLLAQEPLHFVAVLIPSSP